MPPCWDADPALLALALAGLPASAPVHEADLGGPAWVGAAGGRYELVLAVMALHYFAAARVRQLYLKILDIVTPDGLLLAVEPMPAEPPLPEPPVPTRPVRSDRSPPGPGGDGEDRWTRWWRDLAADPAMGPALARRTRSADRLQSAEFTATVGWHQDAARAAGYGRFWPVRRHGDHVLFAVAAAGPAQPG